MKTVHGIVLGALPVPVKSSYSTGTGTCVMIASPSVESVKISDSKLDHSPELKVSPEAFNQMILDVQAGL